MTWDIAALSNFKRILSPLDSAPLITLVWSYFALSNSSLKWRNWGLKFERFPSVGAMIPSAKRREFKFFAPLSRINVTSEFVMVENLGKH